VVVIALLALVFMRSRPATQAATYYEVKRGDFLISIVEGGPLEAVNEVSIRNEVEGVARIIYIRAGGDLREAGRPAGRIGLLGHTGCPSASNRSTWKKRSSA